MAAGPYFILWALKHRGLEALCRKSCNGRKDKWTESKFRVINGRRRKPQTRNWNWSNAIHSYFLTPIPSLGFRHMGVHGQLQRRGRRGGPVWRRLRRPPCYQTQRDLGTCRSSRGSDNIHKFLQNVETWSGIQIQILDTFFIQQYWLMHKQPIIWQLLREAVSTAARTRQAGTANGTGIL